MAMIATGISREEWRDATARYGPWIRGRARRITRQLPAHVARNIYEDLVGVGFRGFVEAMGRLDRGRPETWDAYIKQLISGAMLDELRRLDPLTRGQRRQRRRLREAERGLTASLGRCPTEEEVVRAAGMELDEYRRRVPHAAPAPVSLDAPAAGAGEALINLVDDGGRFDPQEDVLDGERRRILREAVDRLPPPHQTVVQRYYFEGDTLGTIGSGLNVCAARVSQIRKEAVDRIRKDVGERLAS